jgi:hypothetical protein
MARRTAKKLEPIGYDELLNNSSMEGLVSFINYHPQPARLTGTKADKSATVDEASSDDGPPPPIAGKPAAIGYLQEAATLLRPDILPSGDDRPTEDVTPSLTDPILDIRSGEAHAGTVDATSIGLRADTSDVVSTVDRAVTVDEESSVDQATAPPKLSPFSTNRSRTAVDEESTVSLLGQPPTSLIADRRAADVSSTVDPEKIALLNQARPPKELSASWVSLFSGQLYEARKVQWVSIAQHSMTVGQERFYEAIWRAKSDHRFQIQVVNRHQKKFCGGYDVLARITRIADRNVQKNIPQLISKKILYSYGDFDSSARKGTTYDIFSYDEILRRQRAAGLCYIIKNGPGIEFVVPQGWLVSARSAVDAPSSDDVITAIDNPSTDDARSFHKADKTPAKTVDARSTLTSGFVSNKSAVRIAPEDFYDKLETVVPGLGTDAVEQIWRESREVVLDIQPEEIAFWFEQRARMIYQNGGLKDPVGLLLSSVKDWLTERKVVHRRNHLRELAEEEQRVRRQLEGP